MPQFPQPNPMGSLQTLLRMKSPTNLAAPRSQNELDVLTGNDQWMPEGDSPELKVAQEGLARQTGMGFSRDALRGDILSKIKQKLGLQQIEHEQDLESKIQPEIVRGEYGVRAATEAGRAAADRLQYTQGQINSRAEQNQAAIMDRLQATQNGLNTRQEDSQTFRAEHPSGAAATVPAQLYKGVETARGGYDGVTGKLGRMIGLDGGRSGLETALTAVLDRKGTLAEVHGVLPVLSKVPGATIDEKIVNSGIEGLQQLDPYERQYLQLKLGQ